MPLADPFTSPGALGGSFATSHKARYRPGKAPAEERPGVMKRTNSMVSLPSPQSDYEHDEDGMDVDGGLEEAPRRSVFVPARGFADDEDEVDQLDSDTEDEGEQHARASSPSATVAPKKRKACALGSPANLVGGGGASRRQLLNPFLPAAEASTSHGRTHHVPSTSPTRADFPHASPTRRRRDPDRIRLAQTPPQKSRAELAEERRRQEEEEAREQKRRMMGWDDPENPFVERDESMAARLKEKQPMKRPETITLVKRGQRIRTSVPFTAVLTSTSPADDPFTFTAPKLLFPPKAPSPPPQPSTPPQQSKFLEALRAAGASERKPARAPPAGPGGAAQLPPTPVTMKRKAPAPVPGQEQRFGPYKKMRGLGGAQEGGLR
ncbi:hypothetical protein JCM10213_006286 [Rhodosporidiobolus nylandii]